MSTPEMPQPIPEAAPKGLSEPERIIDTFIAPSKTMADIRRNASWWAPLVILALFAILFTYSVDKKIGWEQVMQNQINTSPKAQERMERMPPDQRDKAIQMQVTISRYSGYAAPVFILIIAVVVAAVLMATFNFGFGAEVKFGQAVAIVMYGWLVSIVSTVLAILSMFLGSDPEGFQIRNPVATNPAYFMNPAGNKFLYGVASMFDIIAIWMIFVMAVGFSENSKVKKGTAFAAIFVWYALIKVVGAAFGAAFS
jgi:hypothetical protein